MLLFRTPVQSLLKTNLFKHLKLYYSNTCKTIPSNGLKVSIIGACNNTGQSLALMLKQSPLIDELCLYDTKPIEGFALDLSYVDTKCMVSSVIGKANIKNALKHSKIVVILASQSSKKNKEAIFELNAPIIRDVSIEIAQHAPKALIAIAANPLNSLIPIASEILKKKGCYNPNIIFGITTMDIVRANVYVADVQRLEPECVFVPIIGGQSESTLVPILSQSTPCAEFTNQEIEDLTKNIRNAQKKTLTEDGSLSNAFSIARFIISLVKGIRGYTNIVEYAYVKSKVHPHLKYLSTSLLLGPTGIVKNMGLPKMNDFENCQFDNIINKLTQDIKQGEIFVGVEDPPPCDPCDSNPKSGPCPKSVCETNN